MERKKITVADATRYSHLFRATYWGAFKVEKNADAITAEIIENRNRFARRWRVRRNSGGVNPHPQRGPGYDFDHAELYKDAEGWLVLVCSNYGEPPPPGVLGMVRIAPIYSTAAESYAGRYATRRELKARLAACDGGKSPFGVPLDAGEGSTRAERAARLGGNLAPVQRCAARA